MDSDVIRISKINQVRIKLECSDGALRELCDIFTFDVPGAKFMPAVRNKYWDGKIRLINSKARTTYYGLINQIRDFANTNNYTVEIVDNFDVENEFSLREANQFIETLSLKIQPRDYQVRAFALAVRNNRAVLVCPTGSGKSLIAYIITLYYQQAVSGKTLIIVPTTSLVHQMNSDFVDYGCDPDIIHKIMGGYDKNTSRASIVVSTWQSLINLPKQFFDQFDVVIGDEAHIYKAQSLITIMSNLVDAKYRFGMTGTLDDSPVNPLIIEGVFGKIEKVINTSELIDAGHLSPIKIKILTLNHHKENCKLVHKKTYQEEIEYIISSNPRNLFIRNLALSLNNNTLILYSYVEKHGKLLYEMINEKSTGKQVFFVSGEVDSLVREDIRSLAEKHNDAIIVASYGVFSQGINIKNLHNIIFASPTKSRVRTLQSIGRGLRAMENKQRCVLFDIADNLSYNKKKNYTLNHLIERVKMYNSEQFPYEIHSIELRNQ